LLLRRGHCHCFVTMNTQKPNRPLFRIAIRVCIPHGRCYIRMPEQFLNGH